MLRPGECCVNLFSSIRSPHLSCAVSVEGVNMRTEKNLSLDEPFQRCFAHIGVQAAKLSFESFEAV